MTEDTPYEKKLSVIVARDPTPSDSKGLLQGGSAWKRLFLLIAVLGALFAGANRADLSSSVIITLFFCVALALRAVAWMSAPIPKKRAPTTGKDVNVVVSREGIDVAGNDRIRAESIADALFVPRNSGKSAVRCLSHNRDVLFEAEVDDWNDATHFLRALGRKDAPRRWSSAINPPFLATRPRRLAAYVAAFTFVALLLGVFLAPAVGAVGAIVIGLGVLDLASVLPATLDVGTDGLLVAWFGRRRFVPWTNVRSVERDGSTLRVVTNDGESPMRLSLPRSGSGRRDERLLAMLQHIEDAREAHQNLTSAAELTARLARGSRDVGDWRNALSKLRDGDGQYRAVATREDDLWRVVEDASAPEEARAGAALALRTAEDAAPRLRVAAQAVASPRLRVAFETVADPAAEEAALEKALTRIRN